MNIQSEELNIRNATLWIVWEKKKNPHNDLEELIKKACEKFSLTLIDVGYLYFSEKHQEDNS